jgi:phage terminase large subunit
VIADFPDKLQFLWEPARYKVVFGGRGASKSWGVARWLLIDGAQRPLRILCARETQKSLADSVHRLLSDQIAALGLESHYAIEKATIYGRNGTEFIFAGLAHNVSNIKSLEAVDRVFIEEAQTVSEESWRVLTPTVRKAGSEIIIVFNPSLDTDPTYKRFVINPPTGAVVRKIGWQDNPWFPAVLDIERRDMQRLDPAGYRNVWEGETRSAVDGAIYAGEIQAALDSKRIGNVPRDRARPVDTYWDLGFGDKTAIWFGQAVDGWYRLVDYLEDAGHTIEWYLIQLQNKGYLYGIDWVPHDAVDTIIHRNLAGGDKSRSIEMLMRQAGRNVRIAPKLFVADRINAGRTIFPQCQIDAEACADGLQALRRYQWGPLNANGVHGREPLHNPASHGSDAFQTFAVCAKQPRAPEQKRKPQPVVTSAWS